MIEKDGVEIQDDFLEEEIFIKLSAELFSEKFPWYFNPVVIYANDDKKNTPGFFYHTVFRNNVPNSPLFDSHMSPILEALKVSIVSRILINLNWRLPKPFVSTFHIDSDQKEQMTAGWTTSILYINTNNGYTELEDTGRRIESVTNRLVTFPSTTNHRVVTQTDTQIRLLINFNYLKCSA